MSATAPGDRHTVAVSTLEFWPDYGPGPLWADGKPVNPSSLDIPRDLAARVTAWNSSYAEAKVPLEGPGDPAWIREGSGVLAEIRAALGSEYEVVVTEPWWGEDPA